MTWIAIAGGLFAATCATAAPTGWPAVELLQTGGGTGSPAQTQAPAGTMPPTVTRTVAGPRPKANSLQLYGGLFAPVDVNAPSPTLGIRLGRRLGGHLQGGVLVDWTYQRKDLLEPVNQLPGLQPNLILARAEGQLVPVMAYLEVSLTEKRFLAPYAGIAAGYEWLMLKATDFRTDQSASATYANFAWQGWGGIGLRLDEGLRVDFELNYNGGSLERDAVDAGNLREAVRVNGVGARVGLDIFY